jgi:hypothetical protein
MLSTSYVYTPSNPAAAALAGSLVCARNSIEGKAAVSSTHCSAPMSGSNGRYT